LLILNPKAEEAMYDVDLKYSLSFVPLMNQANMLCISPVFNDENDDSDDKSDSDDGVVMCTEAEDCDGDNDSDDDDDDDNDDDCDENVDCKSVGNEVMVV
jgi:hypothetical protein